MLSQELKSIHAALGCVLPRVDVESAELVRLCRRNLDAAADTAAEWERTLTAPVDMASCLVDRPPLDGESVQPGGRA